MEADHSVGEEAFSGVADIVELQPQEVNEQNDLSGNLNQWAGQDESFLQEFPCSLM